MTDINKDTSKNSETLEVIDKKNNKNSLLIAFVAFSIVLALCVAGASFYIYKMNLSTAAVNNQQLQSLDSKISSQVLLQSKQLELVKLENTTFKNQVEKLNQQLLEVQNKNKLYSSDVQTLQRRVAANNVRQPNDWILSEVEYLINLAGRKLWLEHDITTTISLLSAADQRVIEMRDPSLNPLRRALLEDINMLELLPEHHVDSSVLALSSLERRIDKLIISSLEVPEKENNSKAQVTGDINDWKSNLNKSWDAFIESFIVISHRDIPVEALLSPEQAWYLKENLRNHLSKAEFAVYREQQELYDMSLKNALQLIELYYDMTDKSTQNFHAAIIELSKQQVSFSYPDQFKSAPLLTRMIELRLTKSLEIEDAE